MVVGLLEIITSRGGEFDGEAGGCLISFSLFSDGLVEPDFKDNIANTAASSSRTSESSTFSSERTLATFFPDGGSGGVRAVGVTTIGDF